MMKMHGLTDFAYYSVQYVWFLVLYGIYMAVLIFMGSAVRIGFFRSNSYPLQFVRTLAASCGCGTRWPVSPAHTAASSTIFADHHIPSLTRYMILQAHCCDAVLQLLPGACCGRPSTWPCSQPP